MELNKSLFWGVQINDLNLDLHARFNIARVIKEKRAKYERLGKMAGGHAVPI